jgi:SAM-dependent methyltransferase
MNANQLPQTSQRSPFDSIAPSYDGEFTYTRLGLWLRKSVWRNLDEVFLPGDHILELGCGTGEDAIYLAQRGIQVTAVDTSSEMLAYATEKTISAGLKDKISFRQWDLNYLSPPKMLTIPQEGFDGILSNFGVLNCIPDRRPLAKLLGDWLQPRRKIVCVVMNPWCPWEIAWHLIHGQPRMAFRRLRNGVVSHIGGGKSVKVWYPSPRRVQNEFSSHFRRSNLVGIGVFLPPSYLNHIVERFPSFFRTLKNLEYKYGHHFPLRQWNDHYLIVMERQ